MIWLHVGTPSSHPNTTQSSLKEHRDVSIAEKKSFSVLLLTMKSPLQIIGFIVVRTKIIQIAVKYLEPTEQAKL